MGETYHAQAPRINIFIKKPGCATIAPSQNLMELASEELKRMYGSEKEKRIREILKQGFFQLEEQIEKNRDVSSRAIAIAEQLLAEEEAGTGTAVKENNPEDHNARPSKRLCPGAILN